MDIMQMAKELGFEEGNIPHAYKDHLGFWTIGVGFLIDERKGGGLYPEEIAFILQNRVNRTWVKLQEKLPWITKVDEVRQRVLLSMAYQMGIDGLLGFKNTLKMVEAGDYQGAARGMLNSLWAKQTPNRAKRLADMMATGKPPAAYQAL